MLPLSKISRRPLFHTHLFSYSEQVVRIENENNLEVRILGLDENGYLQAQKPDGTLISLQDDGNSFDMMENLIRLKTS